MKALCKLNENDKYSEFDLKCILDGRFPVVIDDGPFITSVKSRPYESINEVFVTRKAIEDLEKDGEYVIKTRDDYNKFVAKVNEQLMFIENFGMLGTCEEVGLVTLESNTSKVKTIK